MVGGMLGNVEGVLVEWIFILAGRGGAYGCEKGERERRRRRRERRIASLVVDVAGKTKMKMET